MPTRNKELTRVRQRQIKFRVSDEEMRLIRERMRLLHISDQGAYIRKMAIDGYCISLDMADIRELIHLLRMCSNNLNQYAHMANATGNIYREDIQDLQRRLDQIWEGTEQILGALSVMQ